MSSMVPTREDPRRGYRIQEAAWYMGVSPWFVELKVRSGELPALKLCRHYTILREDMDAFLDAQRAKAA
jgi:excisionase family DNA binding protein